MSTGDSTNEIDFYISATKEKPFRGESIDVVWRTIKREASGNWVVGYRNYPFRDYRSRFEDVPDIVILHADIGFCVITCRAFSIAEIESVGEIEWVVNWDGEKVSDTPLKNAREQTRRLYGKISAIPELDSITRGERPPEINAVALPNISEQEWVAKGLPTSLEGVLLFSDDLGANDPYDVLETAGDGRRFTDEEFIIARDQLNQGDLIASKDRTPIEDTQQPNTRNGLYRAATHGFEMHEQDKLQEEIALHIPDGPQQIRGIAGSGKTTIMAKKAATMHLQNPEWDISFTFNTRSLYQTVENSIERFYRDLASGAEVDREHLEILHGWGQAPSSGGQRHNGIYRKIAEIAEIDPYRKRNELSNDMDLSDQLGAHCRDLLESNDVEIPQIYDAILIDEAQDFHPDFYKMCYAALKEPKRLIWAYDEAQSLSKLSAPSPLEIFGTDENEDPIVDLSGSYEGGVKKSHIMRQSYRTPRDVLMGAHAIGMGLYSENGIVHTITNAEDWEAIGYTVEGDFSDVGSEIRLRRDRNLSPHPLQSYEEAKPLIDFQKYEEFDDELRGVARNVIKDITEDNLSPEKIMVVILGPPMWRKMQISQMESLLNEKASEVENDQDELAHLAGGENRNEFWREGRVTLTGINRAKGNEAASVHVMGINTIDKSNWQRSQIESGGKWRDNYVHARNELFVGITRSEGWCSISGHGTSSIINEAEIVVDIVNSPDPILEFEAPDPSEMDGEILLDDTVPTELDYFQD